MTIIILGRIPSKKNSRINTRSGRSFPSKKYKEWHDDASRQLMQYKKEYFDDCSINLFFHMPDNRKADITNKAESVMDMLVDNGILKDDCWQVVNELYMYAELDRINPRVEINIVPTVTVDKPKKKP